MHTISLIKNADISVAVVANYGSTQEVTATLRLVAGDYMRVQVFQDLGVAHNVLSVPSSSPTFTMVKISD
jgi:hypothetical protein